MSRRPNTSQTIAPPEGARVAVMTLLGLMPVLFVSTILAMQMLGIWTD